MSLKERLFSQQKISRIKKNVHSWNGHRFVGVFFHSLCILWRYSLPLSVCFTSFSRCCLSLCFTSAFLVFITLYFSLHLSYLQSERKKKYNIWTHFYRYKGYRQRLTAWNNVITTIIIKSATQIWITKKMAIWFGLCVVCSVCPLIHYGNFTKNLSNRTKASQAKPVPAATTSLSVVDHKTTNEM